MPMTCPFNSCTCSKDLLCYECTKAELEESKFYLREADVDAAALIKLAKGLAARFPGGKRPEWAVPSNCGTALIYIDRLKAQVTELVEALEWLIPPAGCRNYDCEQAQIKVRSVLARNADR